MFAFKSMVPRVLHGFAKDFEHAQIFLFICSQQHTHTHKLTNTKVPRAAWHWKYVTSRTIESYSNVCKIDGRWKVTQWSKQWWHKILQQWWMVTHPSRWKIFQSFKVPHPSVPSFEVRVVEPKAISSVPRTETQFFRGNFQELCRIKGSRESRKIVISADLDTFWSSTFQDLEAFSFLRSRPDSNSICNSIASWHQAPKWGDVSKADVSMQKC